MLEECIAELRTIVTVQNGLLLAWLAAIVWTFWRGAKSPLRATRLLWGGALLGAIVGGAFVSFFGSLMIHDAMTSADCQQIGF